MTPLPVLMLNDLLLHSHVPLPAPPVAHRSQYLPYLFPSRSSFLILLLVAAFGLCASASHPAHACGPITRHPPSASVTALQCSLHRCARLGILSATAACLQEGPALGRQVSRRLTICILLAQPHPWCRCQLLRRLLLLRQRSIVQGGEPI